MLHIDLFEKLSSAKDLQEELSLSKEDQPICSHTKLSLPNSKDAKQPIAEKCPMRNLLDIERPFVLVPATSHSRLAPWIIGDCSGKKWVRLHQEIVGFVRYISPTYAEREVRKRIVREVRGMCSDLWPGCRVETFGSMNTNLLLPKSDIDICVMNVHEDIYDAMCLLAKRIEDSLLAEYGSVRIIDSAKVPIVKFIYKESQYGIDICINAEEGLINTAAVCEFLDLYPMAYPLIMIVKMYLYLRRLHEPYHGGLGSYATTLLVISFLQNHPYKEMQYADQKIVSAGILLADFFRFLGFYFNYTNVGLSILQGGECFRKTDRDTRGLLVEDPSYPENNAGSAARHFGSISRSFEAAYMILMTDDTNILDKLPEVSSIGNKKGSLDEPKVVPHSEWRLSRLIWISNQEHNFRANLSNVLETMQRAGK
ncbi:DNA polymerase sigma [Perkinsela sp. CCAP 1560/4]|nr:DNA polymerase sigma [Perkinsela sp. CCAP 1560/4]|eukprot:KNH09343.1 DNA polymerase sigma [Perkinsela sp. CCAP 1560/4]